MARLAALLLLALIASPGCLQRGPDPPGPTTESTFQAAAPNFLGNWSQAEGNFTPVVLRIRVAKHDLATNESVPPPSGACTTRFSYDLNRENRTLRASSHYPLHPYDPGDLTVVLLNEVVVTDQCIQRGFYGINENGPTPDICLYGVSPTERERRLPWQCRLPIEPFNDARAKVWVNLTVPVTGGRYEFIVNGHTFGHGESGAFTFWTEDAERGRRYGTTVNVEAVDLWPYSSVRRA